MSVCNVILLVCAVLFMCKKLFCVWCCTVLCCGMKTQVEVVNNTHLPTHPSLCIILIIMVYACMFYWYLCGQNVFCVSLYDSYVCTRSASRVWMAASSVWPSCVGSTSSSMRMNWTSSSTTTRTGVTSTKSST